MENLQKLSLNINKYAPILIFISIVPSMSLISDRTFKISSTVLSSDCVLHVRDGEFSWQDKESNSSRPGKFTSENSVSSLANSETSNSICDSQELESDKLMSRSHDNGDVSQSKTLELEKINLHITKVQYVEPHFEAIDYMLLLVCHLILGVGWVNEVSSYQADKQMWAKWRVPREKAPVFSQAELGFFFCALKSQSQRSQ